MKTNLAVKLLFLTIPILATALVTGCQTTKPIDWNSRVGTYTFNQAVTDFGPPDKETTLSDGKLVAQWITHRYGGSSFSVGTGFYTGPAGVGVGHTRWRSRCCGFAPERWAASRASPRPRNIRTRRKNARSSRPIATGRS